MSRHDWYTIENLIAAGDLLPMDLVCSENKCPGSAQTLRGVATTIRSSDRMSDVSGSSDRIAADRIDGAA